ncbi:NUDIX domain-containing protein [Saccharicrinis sp. FJH2]|uniref:NUDIX domain-containing protein n=1 Tax=Saccharicrinis sp. FJH65 TaxID=3344659 RepID=UPI0035F3BF74
MPYTYEYPRPMVTVDIILISKSEPESILLIQRKNEPYKSRWALPGGFVEMDEDLKDAAKRELQEETGIILKELNQFKAYGTVNRDPRGRTISIIFYMILDEKLDAVAADDAGDADWYTMNTLPDLAFDHKTIIDDFLMFRNHLHQ